MAQIGKINVNLGIIVPKKVLDKPMYMSNRWRPSFGPEYKQKIQNFLDRHDELPFDEPKELMKYSTDNVIMDVETESNSEKELADKLRELSEEIGN